MSPFLLRQEFVEAGKLEVGEELLTLAGTTHVTSIAPRGPPEPVYNLEVQGEHVYLVASSGVLVHNTYSDPRHHIFPQDCRHEFEDGLNIPIDDYTVQLPQRVHTRIHPDWNDDWQRFFDHFEEAGTKPTPQDAMNHALELIGEYGLDAYGPLGPWK